MFVHARVVDLFLYVWTFTLKREAFQTMAREIKQRVASQPQANSGLGVLGSWGLGLECFVGIGLRVPCSF